MVHSPAPPTDDDHETVRDAARVEAAGRFVDGHDDGEFRQPFGQDYCRVDAIRCELLAAQRLYRREGWPVVDASAADPAGPMAPILALLRVWRGGER